MQIKNFLHLLILLLLAACALKEKAPHSTPDDIPAPALESFEEIKMQFEGAERAAMAWIISSEQSMRYNSIAKANEDLSHALDLAPRFPFAHLQKGKLALINNDFSMATESCSYASEEIDVLFWKTKSLECLANAYEGQKSWSKAADTYKDLLELHPDSAEYQSKLVKLKNI